MFSAMVKDGAVTVRGYRKGKNKAPTKRNYCGCKHRVEQLCHCIRTLHTPAKRKQKNVGEQGTTREILALTLNFKQEVQKAQVVKPST